MVIKFWVWLVPYKMRARQIYLQLLSSVFALEKQPKNLNFQSFFLPLNDPLMATFNETRAPTSRKYVAEVGILMPN